MATREYWEREDLLAEFSVDGDARRTLQRVLEAFGSRAGRAYRNEKGGYWAFERGAGANQIPIYLRLNHLSVHSSHRRLLPADLRERLEGDPKYPSIYFLDASGRRAPRARGRSGQPAEPRAAVVLAWDPSAWGWRDEDIWNAIAATDAGSHVEVQCPTDKRRTGIEPGDRVFLVSREHGSEGIVASGEAVGQVTSVVDEHDHSETNVLDVALDRILDPIQPLDLQRMKSVARLVKWERPGTPVSGDAQAAIEELWAQASDGDPTGEVQDDVPRRGQARMLDGERRKKVEDAAQNMLMAHYRDQGWKVEDTRFGNPFDARATKDGETVYLEAKGTTSDGRSVILTRGEVRHARGHLGRHVIGILSGIRFDKSGEIVPESGTFRVLDLDPREEELNPIAYDWVVPPGER